MVEQAVDYLKDIFPPELVSFIISLMPIFELRGGLIAAAICGVDFYIAFPICVIGNMLPIPLILLFIRKVFEWLKKKEKCKNFIIKLETRARAKADNKTMQRYRLLGLFLFVAIPIPGTGAWTGALVADILDIRIKYAMPIIAVGVITAGIITSVLAYLIPSLF